MTYFISHFYSVTFRIRKWRLFVILFLILMLIIICVFRKIPYQLYSDLRCSHEIFKHKSYEINGISKQEVISQLIERYDVDLKESAIDPGTTQASWMTCRHVHGDYEPRLGEVLHWLSTVRVLESHSSADSETKLDMHTGHVVAKFIFKLSGGYKALFKVKRFSRETISSNLSKKILGAENHRAEIVSYHLQRILGFNKGPIAVGRRFHFEREILPVVDNTTKRGVFLKDGEICVKLAGKERNNIIKTNKICTENGMLEGVMILWLPRNLRAVPYVNPSLYWYSEELLKEENLIYPIANEKGKLLDAIDSIILDYLSQNMDRHIFYFEPAMYSSLTFLDNGKSFGDPFYDYEKLRDVFAHRCQLRNNTYTRLKLLRDGVLSTVLRHILSRDPIAPVLWEEHYKALDRRLRKILETIETCIKHNGADKVLVDEILPTNVFTVFRDALKFVHLHPLIASHRTILMEKFDIPKGEEFKRN